MNAREGPGRGSRAAAGHDPRAARSAGTQRRGARSTSGSGTRSLPARPRSAGVGPRRAAGRAPCAARRQRRRAQGETKIFDGPVDATGVSFAGALRRVESDLHACWTRPTRSSIATPAPSSSRTSRGPRSAMTTPALFRTQNAREYRNLDRGPKAHAVSRPGVRPDRPPAHPVRGVRHRGRGGDRHGAQSSASGARIWRSCRSRRARRPTPPTRSTLPLSSVARGDFLIAISATAGDEVARVAGPVRVPR